MCGVFLVIAVPAFALTQLEREVVIAVTGGALACVLIAAPADGATLTGLPGLVRVYDAILDARFDEVPAELKRACGPAPAEACDVLAATATWWHILVDPENRALDAKQKFVIDQRDA